MRNCQPELFNSSQSPTPQFSFVLLHRFLVFTMESDILPPAEAFEALVTTALHDSMQELGVNSDKMYLDVEVTETKLVKTEESPQFELPLKETPKTEEQSLPIQYTPSPSSPSKRQTSEEPWQNSKKPCLEEAMSGPKKVDSAKLMKKAKKRLAQPSAAETVTMKMPVYFAPPPSSFDPMDDSKCPLEEAEKEEEQRRRRAEREAAKGRDQPTRSKQRSRVRNKQAATKQGQQPRSNRAKRRRDDSLPTPPPDPEQQVNPLIKVFELDKLPLELRIKIYQHILVARKPIRVHGLWRQVYRHQGLEIPTGILRTGRRVYSEAVEVLYGCNQFVYRLRDAAPTLTDVSQLPYIDHDGKLPSNNPSGGEIDSENGENDYQTEIDSDPEWNQSGDESDADDEGEGSACRSQNRRRRKPPTRGRVQQAVPPPIQPDIYIEKYAHFIRNIVIEAEQNRYFPETRVLMANAIMAFKRYAEASKEPPKDQPAPPKETKTGSKKAKSPSRAVETMPKDSLYTRAEPDDHSLTNIHTLTLRVAPKWDAEGGDEEDPGRFTFVDFFIPQSRVMRALCLVQSQFLRFDLMTTYMKGASGRSGRTYKLDMRHYRLGTKRMRTGHDPWREDGVIERQRAYKNAVIRTQLLKMGDYVHKFCEQHLEKGWDDWGDEIDADEIDNGF